MSDRHTSQTKKKEGEKDRDNVMFIPRTPNGALRSRLTDMEKQMRFADKIRYVETVGQTVLAKLVKQDPFEMPCESDKCLMCLDKPGKCMKKGVVYKISCKICLEKD